MPNLKRAATAACLFAAALVGVPREGHSQELVFLSTQLRPIEEAQKVRELLLKGAPKTTFIVDEPSAFDVRMKAEASAGKHTISLVGALHGELQPLVPIGALDALDDVADKIKTRGIPPGLMELGKFGGQKQLYIPWMQATYVLVVKKDAMPFLPAGRRHQCAHL